MLILSLTLGSALAAGPADFTAALQTYVSSGAVDYAGLHRDGALDGYLSWLETAPEPADPAGKTAFWINAYNALTIDMIADSWPLKSIRDLDDGKVWDARSFTVAGRSVTLNDIEHRILRPMGDARVHAAINCASAGCPPIADTPFSAAALSAELDAASARWMVVNGHRTGPDGSHSFNKIFDWYGEDFVKADDCGFSLPDPKLAAAACFASHHTDGETAAALRAGGYTASFHAYSWRVNAR